LKRETDAREIKLKSIRGPASRKVRSEFDQPRLALRQFSKAQAGYGALTSIKAPAVSDRPDLNSGRARAFRVDPTTSAEVAKKTDNFKAGRGKH
jgi:hypothetical protein